MVVDNKENFLEPVEIEYKVIKRQRWTPRKILCLLQEFECWLIDKPQNVSWFQFCAYLKNMGKPVSITWFWDIRRRFDVVDPDFKDREILGMFKKLDHAIGQKKMEMAQTGRRREASTIFEMKARYGWRDGSEYNKNAQISVNMAISGLSLPDLERRIERLTSKGSPTSRLAHIQAKDAEFEDLSNVDK